jgi:aldehyde:ferredoxin oxidoreductase
MSFTGMAIEINLSNRDYSEIPVKDTKYERNAGIAGIAYEIAQKLHKKKMDPLSDRNFIIFAAGILTSTGLPGATKTLCITKNPLNNTFGPGVVGGRLAKDIKSAGYDLIIIKGSSDEPILLKISSDTVKFLDADRLWGKDIIAGTEFLKKKEKGSVIAIGPAGENLVPISIALVDGFHHLGKGGLGAVFGSKKVKAVIVEGEKQTEIFNRDKFEHYSKLLRERILSDRLTKIYSKAGIMAAWDSWAKIGYLTYKMRSKLISEGKIAEFGVEKYLERIKNRSLGCYGCPSPCKAELKREDGLTKASLYFGVSLSFGVRCGVSTAEEAVKCHDAANRLGIDELTFAELFDMLMSFIEEAKIFEDEIGFPISRDAESVLRMLNMTAYRSGIGKHFGEGVEGLARLFGEWIKKESHLIKNMEWIFDPRVSFGSESFGALTNLRGGHEGPVSVTVLPEKSEESIRRYLEKIGAEKIIDSIFAGGFNTALYTVATENWLWLLNGMGFCRRETIARNLDIDLIRNLFNHATGFEIENEDLIKGAERAISLARSLNCSEGYSFQQDMPPKKFFEVLKIKKEQKVITDYITGKRISEEDVLRMIRDYYRARGWGENGCP